jgi:hypothetical protein
MENFLDIDAEAAFALCDGVSFKSWAAKALIRKATGVPVASETASAITVTQSPGKP